MKINILLSAMCSTLIILPGFAGDYFTLGAALLNPEAYLGQKCSRDGDKIVIKCDCKSRLFNAVAVCSAGQEMTMADGCPFKLPLGNNNNYYCAKVNLGDNLCSVCNCDTESDSVWMPLINGVVYRNYQEPYVNGYSCNVLSSTTYGCAAGLYQLSGSGSSMTCTTCPMGGSPSTIGTSPVGNRDIERCTLAGDTLMKDDSGEYSCSSDYVFKK